MRLTVALWLTACCATVAHADPSTICESVGLHKAYSDAWKADMETNEWARRCKFSEDPACEAQNPKSTVVTETVTRLKLCADAGSADGASLYADWLVSHDLANHRAAAKPVDVDALARANNQTLSESSRRRLERAFAIAAAKAIERIPAVAAEVLKYYQMSLALKPNEPSTAESIGDIIASGDVGANRRFEALDWYYKAGIGYHEWVDLPLDVRRPITIRIFEKMAFIDRDNPLTKRLEQAIYR